MTQEALKHACSDCRAGRDDNGTVAGAEVPDLVMQQAANAIRNSIRPDVTIFSHIETQESEQRSAVIVTVSHRQPPVLSRRQRVEVFRCVHPAGAASVPASEDAIRQMPHQVEYGLIAKIGAEKQTEYILEVQ